MALTEVTRSLLASYERDGGINHLDGANLPAEASVNRLAADFMHLLFPGFFEQEPINNGALAEITARRLADVHARLSAEIAKALRTKAASRHAIPTTSAESLSLTLLQQLPDLRSVVQTDVHAAYQGDPAARNVEEIILAYPCVLVISLQRIAHVLYHLGVPLLPRMLTEYAHERTGCDIHPGARIGPHFFIDHCTGVVIGETATIGSHVKIYQGVTLGAKSFEVDDDGNPVKGVKRHPDIEDHVTIYAHATILGGDTRIGAHSVVGANVWLMQSIPGHSIAYYKGDGLIVRSRRKNEKAIAVARAEDVRHSDWVI